jgi:hypothetical protein
LRPCPEHDQLPRPGSLEVDLLNDRLGEIVARNVAAHGKEVVVTLRKQNPVTSARVVSEIVRLSRPGTIPPGKDASRTRCG